MLFFAHLHEHEMQKSQSLEFKSRYSPTVVNQICGFLNAGLGRIIIGYSEQEQYIGVKNANNVVERILSDVRESIQPNATNYVSAWVENRDNKDVVVIDIKHIPEKKFSVVSHKGKAYYVRVGDRTLRTGSEEAANKCLNSKISGLAISEEWKPSDGQAMNDLQAIAKKNQVILYKIGDVSKGNYLYKYMSLEAALLSIENSNIRFIEPSSWDDAYESRFYNADYHNIANGSANSPKLYACCMTSKNENEAAWKIYSHNASGLASRCVRFKISKSKLRLSLASNLRNCTLYIGPVEYKRRWIIDNIDKRQDPQGNPTEYDKYFKYFSLDNYINLLLLKRPEFDHEKEVRMFIIEPNSAYQDKYWSGNKGTKPDYKPVSLDWSDILEGVDIDKKCSDYEKLLLVRSIANLNGIAANNITLVNFRSYYNQFNIKEVDVYEGSSALKQITIQK